MRVYEAYADALLVIPQTLAESAAMPVLKTIKDLIVDHHEGKNMNGIDVKDVNWKS